jgi:uncharacterized protein (UPF0297 family)
MAVFSWGTDWTVKYELDEASLKSIKTLLIDYYNTLDYLPICHFS